MALRTWAAPLAQREYRLLWIGRTVSVAGDALVQVALIFAILKIGGSASEVGLVAAAQTVTRITFTLAGGVWADRTSRRSLMLASDMLRAFVQATLAVLLITGNAHVWELGLGAAAYGGAQAFFGPASTGLAPELVPQEQLQQANALIDLSRSFFQVAGPAVAGVLVAGFGSGPVFAIDAASFIISAAALSTLRLPPRTRGKSGKFRADLVLGWRELAGRPWYWLNLIAHAFWNVALGGGELDRGARPVHRPAGFVQLQVTRAQRGGVVSGAVVVGGRAGRPAQHRPDAGNQGFHGERLGHVVVATER